MAEAVAHDRGRTVVGEHAIQSTAGAPRTHAARGATETIVAVVEAGAGLAGLAHEHVLHVLVRTGFAESIDGIGQVAVGRVVEARVAMQTLTDRSPQRCDATVLVVLQREEQTIAHAQLVQTRGAVVGELLREVVLADDANEPRHAAVALVRGLAGHRSELPDAPALAQLPAQLSPAEQAQLARRVGEHVARTRRRRPAARARRTRSRGRRSRGARRGRARARSRSRSCDASRSRAVRRRRIGSTRSGGGTGPAGRSTRSRSRRSRPHRSRRPRDRPPTPRARAARGWSSARASSARGCAALPEDP